MNTLVIPIRSAVDFELVKQFIETNLHHTFSWTNIKSLFFEKDNATFSTSAMCDAIAVDSEYPYPVKLDSIRADKTTQYKEIEPDVQQLYQHVAWVNAA